MGSDIPGGAKNYWNGTTYYKGASQPNGIYRVCVSALSGVYPGLELGWECTPPVNMADHDPASLYLILNGPAAINLSATNPRTQWVIGGIANEGDHLDNILFSMDVTSPTPAGCNLITQLLLPGLENRYLFPGEEAMVVYRNFYECHAPAVPSTPSQSVWLGVSHGGGEPLVSQGNNSVSANKLLIIQ